MSFSKEFIHDLIMYAQQNRKIVSTTRLDYLIKLNYTNECQYENIWNHFTIISRGIIIDTNSSTIVAHPFNKFFNEFEYEKQGITIPLTPTYWITEKLDGTLIIPYRHHNELRLSSRGSFKNEYIEKAYQIMTFKDLPIEQYTFMFELISPEYSQGGFLVTKYDKEELILVGMRNNSTGQLLPPPEVIRIAHQYNLHPFTIVSNSINELKISQTKKDGSSLEGWVIFFDYQDGFLVKMKRLEYLNLFRALKNINMKSILKTLINNQFEEFLKSIPEELVQMVQEIYKTIQLQFNQRFIEIKQIFDSIPENIKQDQKDYSLYIIKHYPSHLLPYLYQYKSVQNKDAIQKQFYYELLKDQKGS